MESHVLNMYHQASYCGIGHTTPQSTIESPSSTSESPSSESSCNQSSPEYTMNTKASQFQEVEAAFWGHNSKNRNTWTNFQNVNMAPTSHYNSLEDSSGENHNYERVGSEEVIEYKEEENESEEGEQLCEDCIGENHNYDVGIRVGSEEVIEYKDEENESDGEELGEDCSGENYNYDVNMRVGSEEVIEYEEEENESEGEELGEDYSGENYNYDVNMRVGSEEVIEYEEEELDVSNQHTATADIDCEEQNSSLNDSKGRGYLIVVVVDPNILHEDDYEENLSEEVAAPCVNNNNDNVCQEVNHGENLLIEPETLDPTNNVPQNTELASTNNVPLNTEIASTNNVPLNTEIASTNNVPLNTEIASTNNFNTPVIPNVEAEVKPNNNNLFEIKQDPIDVDKYFNETEKSMYKNGRRKYCELYSTNECEVPKTVPLEIFAPDIIQEEQLNETEETKDKLAEGTINESSLDVFQNIENNKKKFLDEPSCSKSRNAQTPNDCLGLNLDEKALAFTFGHVNLDNLDISLELDKDKIHTSIKGADAHKMLTEEEVDSFFIINEKESKAKTNKDDDLNQEMDVDHPVAAIVDIIYPNNNYQLLERIRTSTPVPDNVLEFCIEKTEQIKQELDLKQETENFVDIDLYPDAAAPVLEANNIDALLEQFEAEMNSKEHRKLIVPENLTKSKCSLTNGVQLQDAEIQNSKSKVNKIQMPPRGKPVIRRPESPIHSDHDYCSPKKRPSHPAVKRGKSLLKPEILSSNNRILNSRHRSCKNKKVDYCLSSDDEEQNDKNKLEVNKRHINVDSDIKVNKKSLKCTKTSVKPINRKKRLSPRSVVNNSDLSKNNDSVIKEDASKATSDNASSQKSNSIKLIIKNKSKVIIKNCDANDKNKDISTEKSKMNKSYSSSSNTVSTEVSDNVTSVELLDRRKGSDKVSMDLVNEIVVPLESVCNKISSNKANAARSSKSLDKVSHANNTVKNAQPLPGSNSLNNESKHAKNFIKSVKPLDRISTSNKVSPNVQNTDKIISSNTSRAANKESTHVKNFVKPVETLDRTTNNVSISVANSDKKIKLHSSDKSRSSEKSRHDKKYNRSESSSHKKSSSKRPSTQEKNAVKIYSEERIPNSKTESSNINNAAKTVESNKLDRMKNDGNKGNNNKNKNGPISKQDHFYTKLMNNKNIPGPTREQSKAKRKNEVSKITLVDIPVINEAELPVIKKKLSLKEYRIRKGTNSNSGSPQVSPDSIFPETPNLNHDKSINIPNSVPSNVSPPKDLKADATKEVFDPILAASKKVLKCIQKKKDKASKHQEKLVIQKVENLVLQPLMSDAEVMKITGMTANVLPVPIEIPATRDQLTDYDELTLVSVGTSTDEGLLQPAEKHTLIRKRKFESPQRDIKSTINFKIKKTDTVLKQNVFEPNNKKRHVDDINRSNIKIDKERLKDITETLKIVEKNVDTKISSNSLFASIQDIVKKRANSAGYSSNDHKSSKSNLPVQKPDIIYTKTTIVREYDEAAPHGEDKVILHLVKNREKPECVTTCVQTEATAEFVALPKVCLPATTKPESIPTRKRSDSDMSLSSDCSPVRPKKNQTVTQTKPEGSVNVKSRTDTRRSTELSQSYERRSPSRSTRYDVSHRGSSSQARNQRKRSRSRNRSRSREYKRYRPSDSPYRRRSRTRSPYRSTGRPQSVRNHYRSNHTQSRSNAIDQSKSRSPVYKKKFSPHYSSNVEMGHMSGARSGASSSRSSSYWSSSVSTASSKSEDTYRAQSYQSSIGSEDRENNTPVEERRVVFVGRLEKDITKSKLRMQFAKFGSIVEVRLHSKEDGSRYGFVTFQWPRDAWTAVEAASTFPQYDVGFGGRRAFCRQSYADLDGLEAQYTESTFQMPAAPVHREDSFSFQDLLLDMKKTMNKIKVDRNSGDMSA